MNKGVLRKVAAAAAMIAVFLIAVPAVGAIGTVDEDEVSCNAAMLVDQYTGEVLYQKNADEKIRPASTTKIMTAVLAMEAVENGEKSLDDVVTVGEEINTKSAKGSSMGLVVGNRLSLEELMYGMMMRSGNDAALVVANYIGGSVEDFVKMMNDKADELGMTGSHFMNPHGMDEDEHYVTASDMAKLTKYATKFSLLKTISSTTTHSCTLESDGKVLTLTNTNYLIYHDDESETEDYRYKYATGLKTGQTPKAGSCLVATGEKDGQKLIALVYGDESEKGAKRWSTAKYLLEFGFTNYESFSMEELAEKCAGMTVTVGNAAENDEGGGVLAVQPVAGDDDTERVTLTTDQVNAGITATVTPKEGLAAPVNEGDIVGTVSLTVEGQEIFSGQVAAMRAVYSQEQVDKGQTSVVTTEEEVRLPSEEEKRQAFQENWISSGAWLWIAVPAALLIVFLIVRGFAVRGRRHRSGLGRRGGRRKGGYTYRPHYSGRSRYSGRRRRRF